MQDLRKWVEAQLKKGYTKESIKQFLVGYGYPQKAVAEVDKIIFHRKRKKTTGAVVFVILLVIIPSIFVFSNFQNSDKNFIVEDEETIIQEFIQENLKEQYQPAPLIIQEEINEINQKFYKAEWTSYDISFYATLYYVDKIPDLFLSVQQPVITGFDEKISQGITKKFFKNVGDDWECTDGDYTKVCESSWQVEKEKNFVGIQTIKSGKNSKSILYLCKGAVGSNLYKRNTCAVLR